MGGYAYTLFGMKSVVSRLNFCPKLRPMSRQLPSNIARVPPVLGLEAHGLPGTTTATSEETVWVLSQKMSKDWGQPFCLAWVSKCL